MVVYLARGAKQQCLNVKCTTRNFSGFWSSQLNNDVSGLWPTQSERWGEVQGPRTWGQKLLWRLVQHHDSKTNVTVLHLAYYSYGCNNVKHIHMILKICLCLSLAAHRSGSFGTRLSTGGAGVTDRTRAPLRIKLEIHKPERLPGF